MRTQGSRARAIARGDGAALARDRGSRESGLRSRRRSGRGRLRGIRGSRPARGRSSGRAGCVIERDRGRAAPASELDGRPNASRRRFEERADGDSRRRRTCAAARVQASGLESPRSPRAPEQHAEAVGRRRCGTRGTRRRWRASSRAAFVDRHRLRLARVTRARSAVRTFRSRRPVAAAPVRAAPPRTAPAGACARVPLSFQLCAWLRRSSRSPRSSDVFHVAPLPSPWQR